MKGEGQPSPPTSGQLESCTLFRVGDVHTCMGRVALLLARLEGDRQIDDPGSWTWPASLSKLDELILSRLPGTSSTRSAGLVTALREVLLAASIKSLDMGSVKRL